MNVDPEAVIRLLAPNFRGLTSRADETPYDQELRISRGADLLKNQLKFTAKNPVSLVYGNPFEAVKNIHKLQNNPALMSQFKTAESWEERLRRLRIARANGDKKAREELSRLGSRGAQSRASKQQKAKPSPALEAMDKLHKVLGEAVPSKPAKYVEQDFPGVKNWNLAKRLKLK